MKGLQINLVLNGEPKSTSHIYKYTAIGGFIRGYMSAQGKALKESYQWQAKSQFRKPILRGPLRLVVRIFFGTRRKADIDNFNKIWLDALTGIVWEDDSQVESLCINKDYDKARPRIEIEITA